MLPLGIGAGRAQCCLVFSYYLQFGYVNVDSNLSGKNYGQ